MSDPSVLGLVAIPDPSELGLTWLSNPIYSNTEGYEE
jgi:hypothetical protein